MSRMMNTQAQSSLQYIGRISAVMGILLGLTEGLYLYTWGPYLYDLFGGSSNSTAMLLTTAVNTVWFIATALLEGPTGAVADAIGRVHTIMLSWGARLFYFICLPLMLLAPSLAISFPMALTAVIFFSIGYTLFNGAFAAWMADWMKENVPDVPYTWAASRFFTYRAGFTLPGALFAIVCYTHGVAFLAFGVAAFLSSVGMIYSVGHLREVARLNFINFYRFSFKAVLSTVGARFAGGMKGAFTSKVLFWIIMLYAQYAFLKNTVDYLWSIFLISKWGAHAFSWQWIGLVVTSSLFSMALSAYVGKKSAAWIGQHVSGNLPFLKKMYFFFGVLSAVMVLTLSVTTYLDKTPFWFFCIAIITVSMSFGVLGPMFEGLANHYIPESRANERATILSSGSMLRSIFCTFLFIPAGGLSGAATPIFWAIPAGLLLISSLIAGYFMFRKQKTTCDPDSDGGSEGGGKKEVLLTTHAA